MTEKKLAIHSQNILPIIKKWLYSDKDIFLRELVSNATDALTKVEKISESGATEFHRESERISLILDKKKKTLTIRDTGIGMTQAEVEKYIAQIAFSGAEDFLRQHQNQKEPIIGHFGLGFYSAYMVSSKVTIETKSYQEGATPVRWECDGSETYTIEQGSRLERGTDIILHLADDSLEYLEERKIQELLHRYCLFLPYPIFLEEKPLNNALPLWTKAPSECSDSDYLAFYKKLYPLDSDPLFWIHLHVDFPFHLKGILFFPKESPKWDKEEGTLRLFCNKVFVSDSCKDLLPEFLLPLKGGIDSSDIPLNVSRSYLQVDHNVKQVSSHIAKKVADKIGQLHKNEKAKYEAAWGSLEIIVKLGILQDEKFYEKVGEHLLWKTTKESASTIQEYLERAKEKKVYYAAAPSPLTSLYEAKGIEILFAEHPIDTHVIHFLEQKLSLSFQRIDSELAQDLFDPSKEKNLLDEEGKTEAARIASFFAKTLEDPSLEVEAKSLDAPTIPALLLLDEKERRLRDYFTSSGRLEKEMPCKRKFLVNTNHPLVAQISRIEATRPTLAKELVQGLFDLAALSQRELAKEKLPLLIERQNALLQELTSLLPSIPSS